jgi:hypothetical protein
MPRYNHMSWCVGQHDEFGECELTRGNTDPGSDEPGALLNGAPCDHVYLLVREAHINTMAEAHQLAAWLQELATLLLASDAEGDCDQHYHNLDGDGNDHIEGCPATWEECPGCGDEWDCDVCNNTPALQCKGECLP